MTSFSEFLLFFSPDNVVNCAECLAVHLCQFCARQLCHSGAFCLLSARRSASHLLQTRGGDRRRSLSHLYNTTPEISSLIADFYTITVVVLRIFKSCAAVAGTFLPWNFSSSAANSVARCLCHRFELHRNVAHFSQIYGALAHLDRRESGLCGDVCAATQLFLGWSLFPLSGDVCGGLAGVEKAPPATTGVSIAHGLVVILCTLFLTFLH